MKRIMMPKWLFFSLVILACTVGDSVFAHGGSGWGAGLGGFAAGTFLGATAASAGRGRNYYSDDSSYWQSRAAAAEDRARIAEDRLNRGSYNRYYDDSFDESSYQD